MFIRHYIVRHLYHWILFDCSCLCTYIHLHIVRAKSHIHTQIPIHIHIHIHNILTFLRLLLFILFYCRYQHHQVSWESQDVLRNSSSLRVERTFLQFLLKTTWRYGMFFGIFYSSSPISMSNYNWKKRI